MNWIPETGIALGHRRCRANDATDLCTLGYELVESRNHPHGLRRQLDTFGISTVRRHVPGFEAQVRRRRSCRSAAQIGRAR